MPKTLQGKYKPKNPKKYKGDITEIYYRSSWERSFMLWCDAQPSVVSWQSEEKCVWYYNPVKQRKCRYFPDFIVDIEKEGKVMREMVEIKPASQVKGPNPNPKRRTKSWMYQVQAYAVNMSKWKAARSYCEDRGWKFRIVTEKELNL